MTLHLFKQYNIAQYNTNIDVQ